ncbi:hypothetical protein EZV62_007181 [Acer yangbiense]|uniref:Peptide-N(4)-(N-acetyl-beta-glucosaminyl)asparagine amidase n=1 Tax=Acer yangbiense TaxID=1000413 RepID=A0A5C7IBV4_9ROSI|nr:hypothetical protein EZV62_007181 [Acer yangbiense]
MVSRKFLVRHYDASFNVDYDTDDGFEIVGDDDQGNRIVSDDSDLSKICDKLQLVSINEETVSTGAKENEELLKSDEELARMLQAEEEALLLQQYAAVEDSEQIQQRLRPYLTQIDMYEDPIRQEAARKTVSVEELEEKALVSLAKGNFKPSKAEQDHAFLLQLLFWCKKSFRWVNAPPCDGCGGDTTNQGMGTPLPSEIQYGASRVGLYRCNFCSRITRFPRYNVPLKLVETREGRCGEWASCFTLYCRAFGYETRLVLDFTDHVWTECFSQSLGRWMHLDPCEGIYDKPLLYENGWNKKLNYLFAFAKDGVYDVTKRYTEKWHEVLSRRNITTEQTVSSVVTSLTKECRRSFPSHVLSALEERDKHEREELERYLHSRDDASVSLPGRRSGDKEWRTSRSEVGSDGNCSLNSTSCPVRVCVDEHVTKIYNAFSPVLCQFFEHALSKSRAISVLEIMKGILVNLKRSSFKTRRVSLNSVIKDEENIFRQMLPSFEQLLHALSLKIEYETDQVGEICLAGDPVKTSLSLPVVLDTLDVMIHYLKDCNNRGRDSLLKLNRICSGSVLASGEELPFGIATSAFDGTCLSKWEEPNGARGCWLMYKLPDNQMHELVAYELRSANDVPERDPKDWVVEGSNDGGSSWHVLDKQTSQMFGNRFQRKTYKIKSTGFLSNAFRFRFLAVRDVNSNSRFQIGSIDLYASGS